ncbi:serine/threonine-protein kinase [Streptomyces sp. NPDC001107]
MQGVLLAERFRIGERLGSGGMGEVWAAQDERMRRAVAVKLVHAMFGTREAETRARFRREVQLAGRLSHQRIVTVHDWGEVTVGGRPVFYLVMELVRGLSLAKRLTEGIPAWPVAVGWGVQIAQALDAAHREGVVHRDIKPANVLITPEGTAKVLDFGVAKFMGETMSAHELTVTGALLGSPPYMSPEQAEGKRELDHRSDLYSLGCLLYHAVTGRPPFVSGSPLAVLRMQMDETPMAPGEVVEGVPWALDELVLSLLAKRPGDRPADAAAVHDALSTILVEQALVQGGGRLLEAAQLGYGGSVAQRILDKTLDMWRAAANRKEEAEAQAEAVLREARADAEEMYGDAYAKQREAERILKDAEEEALGVRAEAERVRAAAVAEGAKGAVAETETGSGRRGGSVDFEMVRRGYDAEQVDLSIDRLLAERNAVMSEVAELEHKATDRLLALSSEARLSLPKEVNDRIKDIFSAQGATPPAHGPSRGVNTPPYGFELVRRGYHRTQVDEYIDTLRGEVDWLRHRRTAVESLLDSLPGTP